MTPTEMDAALPRLFERLAATGAPVVHYKTCSTFDSAPGIGSIGHAVRLGRRVLRNPFVPIVAGQPNLGRYCAFGNLFASAGQGGPVHRIDRHPTMSRHPVTPMGEADLRRHLAAQGLDQVVSFDLRDLAGDAVAREARLEAALAAAPDAVLFDVVGESDLAPIGALVARRAALSPLLAVGPTGVVQALIAFWRVSGELARSSSPLPPAAAADRVLVISGSCSPVTAGQVRAAGEAGFHLVAIEPTALVASPDYRTQVMDDAAAALGEGASVVAHTSLGGMMDHAPAAFGRDLAVACGQLLAGLLDRVPLRRVGIAGGDTSSLATQALGIRALEMAAQLAPGVALCRTHAAIPSRHGLELMLKGGQMGEPDLFLRLLRGSRG
jgi:uncharacterized protein YgbK (DUF1537 family)